jgi:hypothetical protein
MKRSKAVDQKFDIHPEHRALAQMLDIWELNLMLNDIPDDVLADEIEMLLLCETFVHNVDKILGKFYNGKCFSEQDRKLLMGTYLLFHSEGYLEA